MLCPEASAAGRYSSPHKRLPIVGSLMVQHGIHASQASVSPRRASRS